MMIKCSGCIFWWVLLYLFFDVQSIGCQVAIIWNQGQAEALRLNDFSGGIQDLMVRKRHADFPVLGDFIRESNTIIFKPLIYLSKGIVYQIFNADHLISEIRIPEDTSSDSGHVVNIFPATQIWPANILKGYIKFSEPMGELPSKDFLKIYNDHGEELLDVFLELNPDLWNHDQTIMTFWFNPGRIKRGLNPNLEEGNPLEAQANYTIKIDAAWLTKKGKPLRQDFIFDFKSSSADREKIYVDDWQVDSPKIDTREPLRILFSETLDYYLLQECFQIVGLEGAPIPVQTVVDKEGKQITFVPQTPWKQPSFFIEIKTKLEDLAGNNLTRLFDQDLRKDGKSNENRDFLRIRVTL